jgi:hypothetical protein
MENNVSCSCVTIAHAYILRKHVHSMKTMWLAGQPKLLCI